MADLIQIGVDVRTNIKQATADLDKMGGSVVNNINTINRLESEVKQLNRELGRGRVSEAAYAKGMQQINTQLDVFQQRAAKAADVERRFGQTAATGGKSLNRFNMVLQQGGYQLQDFVVQLQSGTSFFTAFSQQGSQFASIFGPQGAVIGAVIALGSAVGGTLVAAFLGVKEEVKSFEDQLDNLTDTLKDYQTLSDKIADSNALSKEFGNLAAQAKEVLLALKELQGISLKNQLSEFGGVGKVIRETTKVKTGDIFGLIPTFSEIQVLTQKQISAAQEFLGATEGTLSENASYAGQYLRLLEQVQSAETFEAQVEPAKQLSAFLKDHVASRELDAETLAEITKMQEVLLQITSLQAQQEEQKNSQIIRGYQSAGKLMQEAADEQKQIDDEREERIKRNYRFAGKAMQEAASEQAKIDSDAQSRIEANYRYAGQLMSQAAKEEQDAQNQLYTNALLVIGNKGAEEQRLANETHAKMMALQKAFYDDAKKQAGEVASATYLANYQAVLAYQQYAETRMAGDKPDEPKAAKVLTNIQDTIDALREQTKHETKLLALTGERLKEEEIYYDLVLKNKDADIKLSDKKLRAIAKEIAAQQQANEMYEEAIQFVDGISDAFSDFVATGLRDFKSFVGSIKDMFVRLLADMAAAAIRNRILIPIATGTAAGFGSTAAASAMGQYAAGGAQAGTIGATLATGMSNFGSAALHTITGGTAGSVAAGSTMASIGAVAPYILAAVAVIGLFTKKVKELDSGLRVTIDSTGTLVEQFNKLQTSRLFGLIKRTSTSYAQAGADVTDPIVDAIGNMQQSIIDAAGTLGIGAAAFDNFSYQFKVSLKGLTEEEQLQKINEEITKMGDSFASLSGHFSTMNELLAAAQQRYDIETRLLGLLNNQSVLLTRQREAERAATNELNRGLLEQVYKLEDAYSAVNSAFAVVQRSIEARKTKITEDFNEIMDALQGRIEAAQAAVGVSGGIVSSLEGAAGGSGMTRGAGLAYLRSLRGASRITDQKKLDDALQAIADPSQDLYTNFVDYQRDFQDQTNLVRELEEKAKLQLSTDEQTLLQLQEEAKAAQARYDSQIEKLDEQLANAQAQLDALYGIDTSVKSVTEAISALGSAINGAMAAQKAAAEAAGVGGGTGAAATGKSFSEQYGTGSKYKGYDLAKLSGSGDLLAAAAMLGVGTTGKTGAQIQQAISNASGMAVRLDNATRSQQFAMGGMFGGGVRMVGERGPELEATGPSRIFSTKQTSELFRNPELVDEVRSLRSEVAGLRSENRQLQTSISKYSKRNYDINRKWDTDGLPATRT